MFEQFSLWMLKQGQRGQGLAEYAIAILVIVIVAWAAAEVLGVNISAFITGVAGHF